MNKSNITYLILYVSIFFLLISCNIYIPRFTLEGKRQYFKEDLDERIGHPMYYEHFPRLPYNNIVYRKIMLGNGSTEWLLDFLNGCKIGVTIKDSNKIVKRWRYISNPDNCIKN